MKPYAIEHGVGMAKYDYDPETLTNRTYVPGLSYMPPAHWNVPQPHSQTQCRNVCGGMANPDTRRLPIGIMDS